MRIEKLECNKIKVTVFPIDLIDMNINMKSLKPDSPQLHSFLSGIMEKIKAETGFNPYSGRTVVEASPIGDCIVLTVTKMTDDEENFKMSKKRKIRAVLKNKKKENSVYFFETFDDMCGAICILSVETLLGASLYKIEGRFVILALKIEETEDVMISEFSSGNDHNTLAGDFLLEHAQLVASGEKLVSMAEGIKKLSRKN